MNRNHKDTVKRKPFTLLCTQMSPNVQYMILCSFTAFIKGTNLAHPNLIKHRKIKKWSSAGSKTCMIKILFHLF